MADTTTTGLLNEIWSAYRRAGVTDDLDIIASLAALLLEVQGISLTNELPSKAKAAEKLDEKETKGKLEAAIKQVGSAGDLFDRYILFRLSKAQAGQYPTPRHIVRLMTAMAATKERSVADFACGSGGLLVHSEGSKHTGIELSPEWARIARANLRLHNIEGKIEEGNALRVLRERSGERYDCVVMNPPFGAKVESQFGSRSETALINLALDHLADNGRAAILVPSGLLFSGAQAERNTRQRLVDDTTLEAVITLPPDSLQPYSQLTSHLVVIHKAAPSEATSTWFLRPADDGYVGGRGRDLTAEPRTPNDLTLVERAFAALRTAPSGAPFDLTRLSDADGTSLGVLIRPAPESDLISARYLPETRDEKGQITEPRVLLLEVETQGARAAWRVELDQETQPIEEQDPRTLITRRLRLNGQEKDNRPALEKEGDGTESSLPLPDIFQKQSVQWGKADQPRAGGILVKTFGDTKPSLIGIAIPRAVLVARSYALQPDDYLRAPEVTAELRRPADILRDIRHNQRDLSWRMDVLAMWLAPQPPKERRIPPTVAVEAVAPLRDALSEAQRQIWDWVTAHKDDQGSARPFALQDIAVECGEDMKRLTLELFEAMGLIVPIMLKDRQTEQSQQLYRLVESNDLWTTKSVTDTDGV